MSVFSYKDQLNEGDGMPYVSVLAVGQDSTGQPT